MREDYTRFVELVNLGADELGFALDPTIRAVHEVAVAVEGGTLRAAASRSGTAEGDVWVVDLGARASRRLTQTAAVEENPTLDLPWSALPQLPLASRENSSFTTADFDSACARPTWPERRSGA